MSPPGSASTSRHRTCSRSERRWRRPDEETEKTKTSEKGLHLMEEGKGKEGRKRETQKERKRVRESLLPQVNCVSALFSRREERIVLFFFFGGKAGGLQFGARNHELGTLRRCSASCLPQPGWFASFCEILTGKTGKLRVSQLFKASAASRRIPVAVRCWLA